MNSRPSWSSKLISSYHPTQATSYWLNSSSFFQTFFPTYSVYLEDKTPEDVPPAIIPHSDLPQCANDHFDTVCTMLLNPLAVRAILHHIMRVPFQGCYW